MQSPKDAILNWLKPVMPAAGLDWLQERARKFSSGAPDSYAYSSYGAALRHSGKGPLALPAGELRLAKELVPGWNPSDWTSDQAARIFLLLALPPVPGSARLIDRIYDTADLGEAVAVQKALPLLPLPAGHVARARAGARSSARVIFEAVAIRNPFPSLHFDLEGWNQLIGKAVFMDVPIAEIPGLEARANPGLAGILLDLADERRAARRPVNPDTWRCVAPFADDRAINSLLLALTGGTQRETEAAAAALAACPHPDASRLLASWSSERLSSSIPGSIGNTEPPEGRRGPRRRS